MGDGTGCLGVGGGGSGGGGRAQPRTLSALCPKAAPTSHQANPPPPGGRCPRRRSGPAEGSAGSRWAQREGPASSPSSPPAPQSYSVGAVASAPLSPHGGAQPLSFLPRLGGAHTGNTPGPECGCCPVAWPGPGAAPAAATRRLLPVLGAASSPPCPHLPCYSVIRKNTAGVGVGVGKERGRSRLNPARCGGTWGGGAVAWGGLSAPATCGTDGVTPAPQPTVLTAPSLLHNCPSPRPPGHWQRVPGGRGFWPRTTGKPASG